MVKITSEEIRFLKIALNYLHVGELKSLCLRFTLPDKGKKRELALRILHFLKTGEVILSPKIPDVSRNVREKTYSISPHSLILKEGYKKYLVIDF